METSWFALRVKPRHEKRVEELAGIAGLDALAPVSRAPHRWTQRVKEIETPLFPGYVFCRFTRADWATVMNLPGVVNVVRFGKTLAAIDAAEIESIRRVEQERWAVEPCRFLPTGQSIEIAAGPLEGLRGVVLQDEGEIDLVLSVSILQRSVRVRLHRDSVVIGHLAHAQALGREVSESYVCHAQPK